jgi:uncharacterized protein (TIGR02996 family)
MTDGDHLYRAILANPADDTLRLAYADWLDENGDPARAEFTRVQCRLASPFAFLTCTPVCSQEYGHAPPCELGLVGDLRRREQRLFGRHAHLDWFVFPGFQAALSSELPTVARGSWLVVERGFVSEVRLPAAAFLGGVYERRITGLAGDLFAAHPITKVVLTNKSPEETPSGWSWFDHGFADDSATITPDLFRHLSDTDGAQPGLLSARMTFATREAALDALSVALVAYGRRAAMLSD